QGSCANCPDWPPHRMYRRERHGVCRLSGAGGFLIDLLAKSRCIDDETLVRSPRNDIEPVAGLHFESQFPSVNLREFDVDRDGHTWRGCGFMGEIDVRTEGLFCRPVE